MQDAREREYTVSENEPWYIDTPGITWTLSNHCSNAFVQKITAFEKKNMIYLNV